MEDREGNLAPKEKYSIKHADKGTVTIKFAGAKFSEVIKDMLNNPNLLEELDGFTSKKELEIGEKDEHGWFYMEDEKGKPFYLAPKDEPKRMDWWAAKQHALSLSRGFNKQVFVAGLDQLKIVSDFIRENPRSKLAETFDRTVRYWSSSGGLTKHAWYHQLSDGAQGKSEETDSYAIRCARTRSF